MMGLKRRRVVGAIIGSVCVLFLSVRPAGADEFADKGRAIIEKWDACIVTVHIVATQSMSMGGRELDKSEEKSDATGTVIDPSGLTVFSLASSDPGSVMSKMMGAFGAGPDDFKMESEINDVKIRLSNGEELASKVVLRDKDLDLIFVRPKETPEQPLPAVDLANSATLVTLDPVIVFNRLGEVASWAISSRIERVSAIIEKPRKYYVVSVTEGFGSPVFALDGKIVGLLLLRASPAKGSAGPMNLGAMFQGMSGLGLLPVVLPAEDILEVAQQVEKSAE